MAKGEGKGWRKGLTAATDDRVARAAASNTGKRRVRRKPWAEMKWVRTTFTALPIEWSDAMAYIVGLTATDGCLITGRRAINFKSSDRQLVETYLGILGRTNRIGVDRTRADRVVHKVQFSDARLYEWFLAIGLSPRKSLILGGIDVPDQFLAALIRGLLDGDGNITDHVWKADTTRRSDYYYEWLRTRFVSASPAHLDWLKARLQNRLGLHGWIWWNDKHGHGIGVLSYGKHDSIKLLGWLYAERDAPCLLRKRAIWDDYCARHPNWVREPAASMYA